MVSLRGWRGFLCWHSRHLILSFFFTPTPRHVFCKMIDDASHVIEMLINQPAKHRELGAKILFGDTAGLLF